MACIDNLTPGWHRPPTPSLAARGSGAIGSDCASNQAVLWIMIPLDEFAETAIVWVSGPSIRRVPRRILKSRISNPT
jgi:hypothetical protein